MGCDPVRVGMDTRGEHRNSPLSPFAVTGHDIYPDTGGRRAHGRPRGASHEVAEAIALSLKTMELLLASVRGYMQASTAQTLLRMIVEYCAGLV